MGNSLTVGQSAAWEMADTLDMALFEVKSAIRGAKRRNFDIGHLPFSRNQTFVSDLFDGGALSGFFKVSGDLWLYLLSEPSEGILKLWVLNGMGALSVATIKEVCKGSPEATLGGLGKQVVAAYVFKDKEWSPVD